MLRIYADFNSCDEDGRVWLNCVGSLRDIEPHKEDLKDGLRVLLYMTGEFEVEANLIFDGIWNGFPDWTTIRYYDEPPGPSDK